MHAVGSHAVHFEPRHFHHRQSALGSQFQRFADAIIEGQIGLNVQHIRRDTGAQRFDNRVTPIHLLIGFRSTARTHTWSLAARGGT